MGVWFFPQRQTDGADRLMEGTVASALIYVGNTVVSLVDTVELPLCSWEPWTTLPVVGI